MNDGAGLVGGAAAGRPLLSGAIIAFAASALAAVGFRQAPPAFIDTSISFLAALVILTAIPAGASAVAPRNFWLRTICAGLAFGILLAARRTLLQAGVTTTPFVISDAFVVLGAVLLFLVLGAPLWRSAVGLSLIGLISSQIGAAAGLAILAIEASRSGALPPYGGPMLALASALGVALSVQIASAYVRKFTDGGNNFTAAASAAQICAAPALYSIVLGTFALTSVADGGVGELTKAAQISAGVMAFAIAAPLFFLPGALALKAQTETTALIENRRRAALRPLVSAIRKALSPSTALAVSAVLSIAAVVAAFEAGNRFGLPEVIIVTTASVAAALIFVSLRTGLLTAALFTIVGLLGGWAGEILQLKPLTNAGAAVTACLFTVLTLQLFMAWRDNRSPRRKSRDVMLMTFADSMFSYFAASAMAVSVVAGSEIAGIWSEGVEVAIYSAGMLTLGAFVSVPVMTAVGALFGRD